MFHDWWKLTVVSVMTLQLSGCSGIRLHDEGAAKTTAGMKEKYAKLDVPGVLQVEKKNLDNLLAEELKTVSDNHQLQVDLALLQMADGNASMFEMLQEARERIKRLGFDDFKAIRTGLLHKVDEDTGNKIADEFGQRLQRQLLRNNITHITCDNVDEKMQLFDNISTNKRVNEAIVRSNYDKYKEACGKLQSYATYGGTAHSSIQAAFRDWSTAKSDSMKQKQSAEEAKKECEAAQKKSAQAVKGAKDAGKSGDELDAEIRKAAKSLSDAIEKAGKAAPGVAAELRLAAIVEVLTAAATGKEKADEASTPGNGTDPNIKAATLIAMTIPSLAGDMKELIMEAKAPSVSNLLIEMNHQMVQLEYEKHMLAMDEERIGLHKAKYDALFDEARYWNKFNDALCSYAMVSGGGKHPGGYCSDGFTVEGDGAICATPAGRITGCALAKPWHENLRDAKITAAMCKADNKAKICSSYEARSLEICKRFEDKKKDINEICSKNEEASRELYKAITAYLGTMAEQAKAVEKDFRLIDVKHRETLAGRRAALLGWDNIVGVPIDQLDAYYQSGLKPAELADLIIKAMGFTAIAIGVSQ